MFLEKQLERHLFREWTGSNWVALIPRNYEDIMAAAADDADDDDDGIFVI